MPPVQPVVGSSGLEPPTSRLSGVRSNHLSYEPISVAVCGPAIPAYLFLLLSRLSLCLHSAGLPSEYVIQRMRSASGATGGDEQNRTVDPLLARQVLSQLSYTPMSPQVFRLHLVKVRLTAFSRSTSLLSPFHPTVKNAAKCLQRQLGP